jgi:hypothetical protein
VQSCHFNSAAADHAGGLLDFYQGIVVEFLRANRATFVNTEYLIDLDPPTKVFQKGRHWYCDAVAVSFAGRAVYLCEITYSKTLGALMTRLAAWRKYWPEICSAIQRTSALDETWSYRPWVFILTDSSELFRQKFAALNVAQDSLMPFPRIETLESVAPWNYCSWDRPDAEDDSNS